MLRFTFGRYKGQPVFEVPGGYLEWCLREVSNLDPWLRRGIRDELTRRAGERQDRRQAEEPDDPPRARPPATWSHVLQQWHREMVLRFHPDRGGSHEAMVALNVAYERLQELTGRAS